MNIVCTGRNGPFFVKRFDVQHFEDQKFSAIHYQSSRKALIPVASIYGETETLTGFLDHIMQVIEDCYSSSGVFTGGPNAGRLGLTKRFQHYTIRHNYRPIGYSLRGESSLVFSNPLEIISHTGSLNDLETMVKMMRKAIFKTLPQYQPLHIPSLASLVECYA